MPTQRTMLKFLIWDQTTPQCRALMARFYPSEYYLLPDGRRCRVRGYGKQKYLLAVKTSEGEYVGDVNPDDLVPVLPLPEFKF